MSVPEFLRKSRTMKVYMLARSILKNLRQLIASEKHIPRRMRWAYGESLNYEATEMFLCVGRANAINSNSKDDYEKRRGYLVDAKAHAETLCYLMDLAQDAGYMKNLSMDYWYGQIDEFLKLLSGLRKSDRERFKKEGGGC